MTAAPVAIFPTSYAQERMWIVEQLAPGSAAYHVPVALRLRGPLDRAALAGALELVVARHEVLRTVFDQVEGRTVQRVVPPGPVPVALHDVDDEAALPRLLVDEAGRAFALDSGPLLRATLFRLGAEDHVLAVTLHHLVSDMWSLGVLLHELSLGYRARLAGLDPVLPELEIQYVDYAVWQRDQWAGPRREELLGFWRDALAGAPAALDLPTDRPRPARQSHRGAQVPVALPADVSAGVRALGRRLGATPFMTLLAGFGAVLGRLGGTDDVVVGTAAGTREPQTEPLIGCFLNTVPLRLRFGQDPSFAALVGRVRATTLGALEHQDLPFDKLVDDLAPRRDLSRNPVTQVMFVVQNAPEPVLDLPGLQAEPVAVERGGAQCDVSVQLREVDGRYEGFVEYAADLFDAATVRRWWGHLATLLQAAVADPDAPLSRLPWLTSAQVGDLLAEGTGAVVPIGDGLAHEAVAERARTHPDAPAVVWDGGSLGYADLDRRADRVAALLAGRGIGRGDLVAVHRDRDADLVAAVHGVLRAGAAYVPLNVDHPAERLAATLADARPAAVLTSPARRADLPADLLALVTDDLTDDLTDELPVAAGTGAGDPAYVIHTSGSTGVPKGVVVEHRAVTNLLATLQERYPIGPDDVVLLKTPASFDVSVAELFWWATAGSRLALLPAGAEHDPRALLAAIERHGVTVVQFVPSMLGPFLDLLGSDPDLVARAASLRAVLCAGEELPAAHVRRFGQVFAAASRPPLLANLYGPTEATVYASGFDCPPVGGVPGAGGDGQATRVPIGGPLHNTQLHVLDAHDRVQAPGVPGELAISGAGLAHGYLRRPALTAERFVPHPYAGIAPGVPAGARMYRSGDLCRRTASGALEWLGRLDDQVKVRGVRVELGEVRAALAAHPQVAEAVVVQARDGDRAGALVAYHVAAPGPQPSASELRRFLLRTLPGAMVPATFVALEAMPLSPNGKVDVRALPAPGSARPSLQAQYVAPRSALERVVAGTWGDVLRLDRVGVHDDFFDLGGQSLLATQVASELEVTLGVAVPLQALFTAPTVQALADHIFRSARDAGIDVDEVAELVLQVRDLTDEEVRGLLADHG